jgi:hypothetical protein
MNVHGSDAPTTLTPLHSAAVEHACILPAYTLAKYTSDGHDMPLVVNVFHVTVT